MSKVRPFKLRHITVCDRQTRNGRRRMLPMGLGVGVAIATTLSAPLATADPIVPPISPETSLENAAQAVSKTTLGAIVQLQDLDLPDPIVSGNTTVPLGVLQESRGVYTVNLEIDTSQLNVSGVDALERSVGEPNTVSGRFLLDTGASTTLLSAPLRQTLGISGTPVNSDRLSYAVAGKNCPEMTAHRLTLPPLQIAESRVSQLQVLQFDQTLIPEGADGVLGMDVLDQFQFTIDPEQRRLRLRLPSKLPSESFQLLGLADRLRAIPLEARSGVMLAQIKLEDQGPFTMLLDTGADGTFIAKDVANQLQLQARKPIKMLGFCGLEDAEMARLDRVSLQNHSQTGLDAVITDSSILSTLKIDGVLGQNFLNHYRQHWHLSGEENSGQNWLILELTQTH